MWTDSRYYLAAGDQLYEGWEMMKMEPGAKRWNEWIKENMPKDTKIGVDVSQIPAGIFKARSDLLKEGGITLEPLSTNLVDEVWGADKPAMPNEKVWVLDDKYTGQSVASKFKDIASKMPEGCDMMFISTLDDIAWMLNLRGNDIEFNPLFFSYAIFHKAGDEHRVDLFITMDKVSDPAV